MNLFDIIFFGWYQILDKTIYSLGFERGAIGPKEHSFFVTFLVHGINVSTILSFLLIKFFNVNLSLYVDLFLGVIIFAAGYLVYFRRGRATKIIMNNVNNAKAVLFVISSLTYVVISVYLMFEVGNYVRFRLGN